MQAVLLAGGLGTRLRSVVADRPKVMADVAGKPFLEQLLGRLAQQGVQRVVLAVGYLHEQITAHFGDSFSGMALHYSVEDSPLGTGGAVQQALQHAAAAPCFVLNADTWLDLDMQAMLRAHQAAQAAVSMAVRHVDDVGRFGALNVQGGHVLGFIEKGRQGPGHINAGVYLLPPDAFQGLGLPPRFSIETDYLMPQVGRLRPLAFEVTGDFIDIGLPEDYARAQQLFAARA